MKHYQDYCLYVTRPHSVNAWGEKRVLLDASVTGCGIYVQQTRTLPYVKRVSEFQNHLYLTIQAINRCV